MSQLNFDLYLLGWKSFQDLCVAVAEECLLPKRFSDVSDRISTLVPRRAAKSLRARVASRGCVGRSRIFVKGPSVSVSKRSLGKPAIVFYASFGTMLNGYLHTASKVPTLARHLRLANKAFESSLMPNLW